ncbi:hypothetical protein ACEPPN_015974 [Leptodophora sp. 'Broadleaf-Isolate-01']
MFRGAVIYLIYDRTLTLAKGGHEDSAAVSLMSNDVDRIAFCLAELNECWSRLIEIAIGLPLLSRQLGWVSIVPLFVVGLSTVGTSIVTKRIGKSQRVWAGATQRRIATTSSMLQDMKSVKIMGLSQVLGDIVQGERVAETNKMESWAWIIVWQNVIANMPMIMAPAATFGVYAIKAAIQGSRSLDTVQTFTSLALITLVSHPTSRLLSAIPNVAATIGCFDRIQTFLLARSQDDSRICLSHRPFPYTNLAMDSGPTATTGSSASNPNQMAMAFRTATISPSLTSDLVLKDINLSIPQGNLVMILGPVGSGKSVLLKAILGEIICSSGYIEISNRSIAYCSQSPWLINGSVEEAIRGYASGAASSDETWYRTVLEACVLSRDMLNFASGDQTNIGSRGVKLSGGQKQRIALARAVYSRSKILVLDDVLSALDKQTERKVIDNLLGTNGMLQKMGCTVIMVTHSRQYVHLADQVVVIDAQGVVVEQQLESITSPEVQEPVTKVESLPDEVHKPPKDIEVDSSKVEVEIRARDLSRESGDTKVYKYYFDSIGAIKLAVFVAFVLLNVFSSSFSRKKLHETMTEL